MRNKEWLLLVGILIYSALSFMVSLQTAWGFTTDDAFISWLYARQLVNGQGLIWHSHLASVEGYSNFLWVLLSAAVQYFQWPLIATMKCISVISMLVGFAFLYRLGRYFLNPLLALLPVFILSQFIGVIWWTVSGLESAFFLALVLIYLEQGVRAIEKHSFLSWCISTISLLLLSLTRFEGIIWVLPLLFFGVCLKYQGQAIWPRHQLKRWCIVSVCGFILPYLIYQLWHFYYFREWTPNSYRCKSVAVGEWGVVVLDYVQVALPFLLASLPFFVLKKQSCRSILLWLPSLLYVCLLWRADPVIAHFLRLFLAPLALYLIISVLGVQAFLEQFSALRRYLSCWTTLVIIALSFWFISYFSFADLKIWVEDYEDRSRTRMQIAYVLNQNASLGASVLIGDCGVIPFYARKDLRFIDILCLNNYELSHAPYAGNIPKYVTYVLKNTKPEWMVLNESLFLQAHSFEWELKQQHFLNQYTLFGHYESGVVFPDSTRSTLSYHYVIYKRNPSS